jgi:CheY-like chemotaxis protein
MSNAPTMFPRTDAISPTKKKRVLLVDSSRAQRDLRSETMRRLGVEVDCAADISEARCWWRPQLYDLVLLHVQGSATAVERFCADMRSATPIQSLRFLVGRPAYLSSSPQSEQPPVGEDEIQETLTKATRAVDNVEEGSPCFGILEACRRISAIRSVCDARTRALRDRPEPRRDSEIRSREVFDAEIVESIADAETVEFLREEVQ